MIINSSYKAYTLLKRHINRHQEEVWILTLNSELKLIDINMLFRGTVDHCTLHPRDLIRLLCIKNASSFIMGHNHPSGNLKPSKQDLVVTNKIMKISKLLEVPINDHLILTTESYLSLADHGFFTASNAPRAP